MNIEYILPNGHYWRGKLLQGACRDLESSIGLNSVEKQRIRETSRMALDLGINEVHYKDGAKLTMTEG